MELPVDARLLAELFDRHCASLEFYASQWTLTPDDCVQEAFVELARQTECPAQPVAWLYRVVRHRALNAVRAANRRSRHEQIAAKQFAERVSTQLDAADKLSLRTTLAGLAETERELVVLRIWSELTWQEIAELTGTSSSSAQRRYVAALEQMRLHLEPSCLPNSICQTN